MSNASAWLVRTTLGVFLRSICHFCCTGTTTRFDLRISKFTVAHCPILSPHHGKTEYFRNLFPFSYSFVCFSIARRINVRRTIFLWVYVFLLNCSPMPSYPYSFSYIALVSVFALQLRVLTFVYSFLFYKV